jgi:hypothetical protein
MIPQNLHARACVKDVRNSHEELCQLSRRLTLNHSLFKRRWIHDIELDCEHDIDYSDDLKNQSEKILTYKYSLNAFVLIA